MRVVYDPAGSRSGMPLLPPWDRGRRETVLVLSRRRESRDGEGVGLSLSNADYEVRISDEALARDREVRAHEQAHLAALGGAAASGVIYETITGPGGESIAVGGRIAVDLAEVPGDPAATLRKARQVIAAAYAPGDPSAADQRVAARAYDLLRRASAELREGMGFSAMA